MPPPSHPIRNSSRSGSIDLDHQAARLRTHASDPVRYRLSSYRNPVLETWRTAHVTEPPHTGPTPSGSEIERPERLLPQRPDRRPDVSPDDCIVGGYSRFVGRGHGPTVSKPDAVPGYGGPPQKRAVLLAMAESSPSGAASWATHLPRSELRSVRHTGRKKRPSDGNHPFEVSPPF